MNHAEQASNYLRQAGGPLAEEARAAIVRGDLYLAYAMVRELQTHPEYRHCFTSACVDYARRSLGKAHTQELPSENVARLARYRAELEAMRPIATLLAIDPGVRVTGWAAFADGELLAAGISKRSEKSSPTAIALIAEEHASRIPSGFDVCVVERMIHYPEQAKRGKSRQQSDATAQDLIDCATIGALVAGRCGARIELVPARTWKGQVPKEVTETRTRKILTFNEVQIMDGGLNETAGKALSLIHNGIDAVGIGLHFLGRKIRKIGRAHV